MSAILTYHSIDPSGSVISIAPEQFRRQIEFLAASGIPVVPLHEIRRKARAIALTFDDGFRNFFRDALPLLVEHHLPATVFAVSGYVGRRNDWPSQLHDGIPALNLMSWSELAEAARLRITIGSHSVTHPNLKSLPAAEVVQELERSRAEMEQRLGQPVDAFAYPYGASTAAVRRLVAERFSIACGARLRLLSANDPAHDLPRVDVYYLRNTACFEQLMSHAGRRYIAVRRILRGLRGAVLG